MNLQVRGNDENGNIDLFSPIAQEYQQKRLPFHARG